MFFVFGAHKARVLLSLQSNLPNEIDWAINKLIKISFRCPDNFHIGSLPGLLDALLDHLEPMFSNLEQSTDSESIETKMKDSFPDVNYYSDISVFSTSEANLLLERTLQILHILRNLSYLEHNAKY